MTADDFRDLALSLEGTIEMAHMGHPDFRANGRIFASLQADEQSATVKLSPDEQRTFVRDHPTIFEPAAGAWGRQGWTRILLRTATRATLRAALLLAWEQVMHAPPRRPTPRASRSPSSRGRRQRS